MRNLIFVAKNKILTKFYRPLIKLTDRLLLVGTLTDEDIEKLLLMIDPETWDPSFDREGKDEHRKGLLTMKMAGEFTQKIFSKTVLKFLVKLNFKCQKKS